MIAEVVFVNSYNLIFNPISQVKKANFQGIFYNYPEPGPEPELQFWRAAQRSRSRKK